MTREDKTIERINKQAASARKEALAGDPAVFTELIEKLDSADSPPAKAEATRDIHAAKFAALTKK